MICNLYLYILKTMLNTLNHFKNLTIYVMSLLYIIVGIKHFTDPVFFLKIMPSYLSYRLS